MTHPAIEAGKAWLARSGVGGWLSGPDEVVRALITTIDAKDAEIARLQVLVEALDTQP